MNAREAGRLVQLAKQTGNGLSWLLDSGKVEAVAMARMDYNRVAKKPIAFSHDVAKEALRLARAHQSRCG